MQVARHNESARSASPAAQHLARRAAALRRRIESLTSLKQLVALDGPSDLAADEWNSVNSPLGVLRDRLLVKLPANIATMSGLELRRANSQIGDLELEASKAFGLFDTFMDILTQRHSPALGPQLRGCDVLAAEALRRDTPALISCRTPIVYCNRGYGAAVVRSDARLYADIPNLLPLIQIPYGRLQEKLQLTSLLHEVGHEAAGRLALLPPMRTAIATELTQQGTSSAVIELYVHWLSEIAADLWSFLLSGVAHAATLREILALPAEHTFRLSMQVPHPPPYLRALLGFQLCRDTWGTGAWDSWESQWLANYPREDCPPTARDLFDAARAALPQVSHILLNARYKTIGGRKLAQLFDLDVLSPVSLARHAKDLAAGRGISSRLPACAHLAVFRYARDRSLLGEDALDRQMKLWLYGLAGRRSQVNVVPLARQK